MLMTMTSFDVKTTPKPNVWQEQIEACISKKLHSEESEFGYVCMLWEEEEFIISR